HEQAIAELEAVLRLDRADEQSAKNREVLVRALEEMRRARLLGKTARELEASAIVASGALVKKESAPRDGAAGARVRYASPLVELDALVDAAGAIEELVLVFPRPERAAEAEGDAFRVTVLDAGGHPKPADLATAATLTFLREALGCPMTQAGALYARLLAGEAEVAWAGAVLAFTSAPSANGTGRGAARHGLAARTREHPRTQSAAS
ncbi:MAG TPA: hypothetical protein VHB21_18465, partial [Minicystis sp.]|nr:hypothetical protein [Minicystis sp.]